MGSRIDLIAVAVQYAVDGRSHHGLAERRASHLFALINEHGPGAVASM
jgi:hypothetical protein